MYLLLLFYFYPSSLFSEYEFEYAYLEVLILHSLGWICLVSLGIGRLE